MTEHLSPRLRVLLVDDCPDVCDSMAMLMRMWGHDVRTVGDGPVGLRTAANYQPHVVLLDVGLPGMDGYEVARQLRAHPPARPRPRTVTLSGHGLEEDFQRSRTSGCDRHLVKPVDLRDLQQMLDHYAEVMRPQEQPVG